jgi:hypothetical protein
MDAVDRHATRSRNAFQSKLQRETFGLRVGVDRSIRLTTERQPPSLTCKIENATLDGRGLI